MKTKFNDLYGPLWIDYVLLHIQSVFSIIFRKNLYGELLHLDTIWEKSSFCQKPFFDLRLLAMSTRKSLDSNLIGKGAVHSKARYLCRLQNRPASWVRILLNDAKRSLDDCIMCEATAKLRLKTRHKKQLSVFNFYIFLHFSQPSTSVEALTASNGRHFGSSRLWFESIKSTSSASDFSSCVDWEILLWRRRNYRNDFSCLLSLSYIEHFQILSDTAEAIDPNER